MHKARTQEFNWSDCSVADVGNCAFLKGERAFIAEQKDRHSLAVLLPTFWAGVLCIALSCATPLWFSVPASSFMWFFGFSLQMDSVRRLKRLTPDAILIKGEVFAVSGSSDSDTGYQLSVRFQTPDGQTKEATRPAKASPYCQWFSVGDKVVVLFANADNFWVL